MDLSLPEQDWDLPWLSIILDPHISDPTHRAAVKRLAVTGLGMRDAHTLIAHHPTWAPRWGSCRSTRRVDQNLDTPALFDPRGTTVEAAKRPGLAVYWEAHDLVTSHAQDSTTTPERELAGPGTHVMHAFAGALGADVSRRDQARAVVVAVAAHACLTRLVEQTGQGQPSTEMSLEHISAWWNATARPEWARVVLRGGNPWAPLADMMDAWYTMIGLDAPWYAAAGYTLTEAHRATTHTDPSRRPTREALTFMSAFEDPPSRPVEVLMDEGFGALSSLMESQRFLRSVRTHSRTTPAPVDWLSTAGKTTLGRMVQERAHARGAVPYGASPVRPGPEPARDRFRQWLGQRRRGQR